MISPAPYLIVAAHPDDEVLGLGGQLHTLPAPLILHTTDGAPWGAAGRKEYAARRRRELEAALAIAGIASDSLLQVGAVDQETPFHLCGLTRLLRAVFANLKPKVVFTHPYEGGHPDHDSASFCVQSAVRLLRRDGLPVPLLMEFTSYYNGSPHHQPAWLKTGEFLPHSGQFDTLSLSPEAADRKRRMLACFASQRQILSQFPTDVERTRNAPSYDFTRAPHPGTLFYESQNWGVKGEQWRRLAQEALEELDLEAPAHDRLQQPDYRLHSFSAA